MLSIKSSKKTQFIDITSDIQKIVSDSGIGEGFVMVFIPHTTAGITINENADPAVKSDMLMVLNKIIPENENYRHLEGNSPAHLKSTLVGASEMVSIEKGRLCLGTWQAIFFCEFDGPRTRKVHVRILEGAFKS
jgi:secondary thiamine-phosphate synthase enzyme